jgi:competence protein ComEC
MSLVQALLLGQRQELPADIYKNFKRAGAVHILAVSGLHIGILLWFLQMLLAPLQRLPRGNLVKLITLLALLWGYALIAGLSASIIRAVSMFSFVAYALYLSRPSNTFNILALSMFFILLAFNPNLLFLPGFQMSYAAVFSIVWMYPRIIRLWTPPYWILKKGWQLLSVSITAQLGVLPVSLYYFHQFPGLFFISNLLIVPFLGVLLGLGFVLAILSLAKLQPLVLIDFYELLIRNMIHGVGWVSRQEQFFFEEIPFDCIQLLILYFVIGCIGFLLEGFNFKMLAYLMSGVIALQAYTIGLQLFLSGKEEVYVLHQWRNTVLMHRQGRHLYIAADTSLESDRWLSAFRTQEGIRGVTYRPLAQKYSWKGRPFYLLKEKEPKLPPDAKNGYLLLSGSPKIHLDRVLDSLCPVAVIADGSNYSSFVRRWQLSCGSKNIPFHNTATDGAFTLSTKVEP